MGDVTIYTTATCPYCLAAKQLITSLGASYEEISFDDDPQLRLRLSERYSWRSVPMILVNSELVGGFDDLMKLHQAGELQPLLTGDQQ